MKIKSSSWLMSLILFIFKKVLSCNYLEIKGPLLRQSFLLAYIYIYLLKIISYLPLMWLHFFFIKYL